MNKKVATIAELKAEQDEIIKLKAFDSSYIYGKSNFEDNENRNYLVLQSIHKYFKKIGNSDYILSLKSKGLFDEYIKSPATSGNSLALSLDYIGVRKRVELVGQWSTLIWVGFVLL